MRAEEDFGSRIRTALQKECSDISASEGLKSRIDEVISKKQEENSMKHMSAKKMCIGVAAACLLISGITVSGYVKGGTKAGICGGQCGAVCKRLCF